MIKEKKSKWRGGRLVEKDKREGRIRSPGLLYYGTLVFTYSYLFIPLNAEYFQRGGAFLLC